jgi:hypothetical protein
MTQQDQYGLASSKKPLCSNRGSHCNCPSYDEEELGLVIDAILALVTRCKNGTMMLS